MQLAQLLPGLYLWNNIKSKTSTVNTTFNGTYHVPCINADEKALKVLFYLTLQLYFCNIRPKRKKSVFINVILIEV